MPTVFITSSVEESIVVVEVVGIFTVIFVVVPEPEGIAGTTGDQIVAPFWSEIL